MKNKLNEIDNSDFNTMGYCTCDKYQYEEHVCPYSEEINNNSDYLCNCCPYCEHQCAMDT